MRAPRACPASAIRPAAQHVGAVGELDRARRVLLDQQDRHARRRAARPSVSKTRSTMLRRRARATARRASAAAAGEQRPGDRQLLLLAARELAGRASWYARAGPGSARARARRPRRPRRDRWRGTAPRRRFSATVSVAKIWRPSGTSATPRRTIALGRLADERCAPSKRDRPAGRADEPGDRRERRRLAGAVGPTSATASPSATCEDDAAGRRRSARSATCEARRSRSITPPRAEVGVDHGRVGAAPASGVPTAIVRAVVEHLDRGRRAA